MTPVLDPRTASLEIERVVIEHWFRMLPAGSVDLLALSMFRALVEQEA